MIKKYRSGIWRYLTNFWTILSFFVIFENFRRAGALSHLLGPVLSIYVAILAIFSAEKEFERWNWREKKRHLGEMYVWAWSILIVSMVLYIFITRSNYRIESEIFSTYIIVLGILAITRKSKQLFVEKGN